MSALTDAQIRRQAQIRGVTVAAIQKAWDSLPGYDKSNVAEFLDLAVPLVTAAQRNAASVTNAYVGRVSGNGPSKLALSAVTGAAVRKGTSPKDVYRRPFVDVWSALKRGDAYELAVAAGRARAAGSAAMDVQLAQRATLGAVSDAQRIRGYQRVADAGACTYCQAIDGAFVKSADAMALHNGCGCTLEPLFYDVAASPLPDDVAVNDHGELGPMLGSPDQNFTQL